MSLNDANYTSSSAFLNAPTTTSTPNLSTFMNKSIGTIYIYKNDPKLVNKGVNISNFRHAQGGYLPLLADSNYKERKHNNLSYSYDTKTDHGSRPMHRTTFKLSYSAKNDYATKNKIVSTFNPFKLIGLLFK
jgi:hypothetical protein